MALGPSVGPTLPLFPLTFILTPFVLPAILATVILGAPPDGFLATMSFAAAEGAAQILATGVTRMREKKDPAMPAPRQASSQRGFGSQDRPQEKIVLQDQGADL
jgi:hypothetical protein